MRFAAIFSLIFAIFVARVACQWGGGWNNYNNYNNYGGGWNNGGGGFGAQQAWNVQNAARVGTEVAEAVLVAEEVQESIGK
ncbi:unnamed protein product [Caenorhabditis angaria]|uniref:Uncharacterized protein n=1 Tax=Caenorhabditis angaria TaxID=860376 RepID=A0A9P1ITW2_9PELO|nr:unnamed protein product [Caenorhabditis angaria]